LTYPPDIFLIFDITITHNGDEPLKEKTWVRFELCYTSVSKEHATFTFMIGVFHSEVTDNVICYFSVVLPSQIWMHFLLPSQQLLTEQKVRGTVYKSTVVDISH